MRILRLLPAFAPLLAAGACIPYATGTTAHTVPRGEFIPSASVYFIPGGLERLTVDSVGGSYFGVDSEVRLGLNDRSDLGIRAAGWVGVIVNYKQRIDRAEAEGPALAYMVGAGVVNAGEHAHVEASLLASGRQVAGDNAGVTPYGGVKAMHVFPMVEEAVSDDPTVGVFAGVRIGTRALAISPEIAVFRDRSALGLRDRDWIVVPSFTFHGDELVRRIFGGPESRPPPAYPPRPWP